MSLNGGDVSVLAAGIVKFKTEVSTGTCNTRSRVKNEVDSDEVCVMRCGTNMLVSVVDCSLCKK